MTPADVYYSLGAISLAISGLTSLLVLLLSSRFASRREHEALAKKHAELEQRVAALPPSHALSDLTGALNNLHGDFREHRGEMAAIRAAVARLETYLLERDR